MTHVNALIVFYSRYGNAEKLALAAGVGAIQARANIRLRRLADRVDPKVVQADAAWTEHLDRMNRDYVIPRPADPVWADVIFLATPADSSIEVEHYVSSLGSIGPMTGKLAAPLAVNHSESALKPIYAAAAWAGLIVAPAWHEPGDAVAVARAHGERVSRMARTLKEMSRSG